MCGKCQDRGFTEENHGLIMVLCDCEKGRKLRAELGIPERESDDNRTEPDNSNLGSGDTSQPKRTRKPKTKKKVGARTS